MFFSSSLRASSTALGPFFNQLYTITGCYPTGDMQRSSKIRPAWAESRTALEKVCNVAERTEPVGTSGSGRSPMSSDKTQQRQRQRISTSNCWSLGISVPSFRSSALPLTVLLLRYRERTKYAQHRVYSGGVCKGSIRHSLILSDAPTISLKSHRKNEAL